MPDTTLGITYPASTDHTRMWEHFEEMADDVDTLIAADRTTRDAAWSSFTPTFVGATSGGTLGNATVVCRYKQYGRLVVASYRITWGSTTSAGSGNTLIGLPVTAQATDVHIGDAFLIDASGGRYPGCAVETNTTSNVIVVVGAGNNAATQAGNILAGTVPFTWTTSDVLRMRVAYEAASA